MGIFDKMKGVLGVDEDDFDDLMDDDIEEDDDMDNILKPDFNLTSLTSTDSKQTSSMASQLDVILVKPEKFEEASSIADNLNAKKTVVLNLENTSKEIARRLVDFLSGVAYANSGQLKKIANSTFIIIPYNANFQGMNILEDLDNNQGVLY